jgi:hypothetical protein
MMAVMGTVPMMAQETYENAKLVTLELGGTARYVGMGGAMEALGADITTMSTNPAGIGMFRRSNASLSFGVVSQQDAVDFAGASATKMSFDQAGFVYSMRTDVDSWLNFGFNYHKGRNFNYILSATDQLQNASQNKLTYAKAKNGLLYEVNSSGTPNFNSSMASCTQLDDIYARNLNYNTDDNTWYYDEGTGYLLDRSYKGYISNYDLNLSGNIHNRVYLGLTVGLYDVNYRHYGEYTETLLGPNGRYDLTVSDERVIDGTGVDIKAGVIVRPLEESAFRIGAYIHTPTWYDLKTENNTIVSDRSQQVSASEAYDFKLYTPWKFGLSAGHTIGTQVALGATLEYADYGSMDTRYITGRTYDAWGSGYDDSESDAVMNRHTEETLKGVATLKVGAEVKPDPTLAFRLGYNFVSPMYKKEGYKDGTLMTDGSYYATATDYTNWKATHRITAGAGVKVGAMNIDLAYQYSTTNGEFSPFMNYVDNSTQADDNVARSIDVSNKRHQVLLTLGYTF